MRRIIKKKRFNSKIPPRPVCFNNFFYICHLFSLVNSLLMLLPIILLECELFGMCIFIFNHVCSFYILSIIYLTVSQIQTASLTSRLMHTFYFAYEVFGYTDIKLNIVVYSSASQCYAQKSFSFSKCTGDLICISFSLSIQKQGQFSISIQPLYSLITWVIFYLQILVFFTLLFPVM